MDDELYHYGVKGMKWGIRRTPAQLGHKTANTARKVGSTVGSVAKKAGKAVSGVARKAYQAHKDKKAAQDSVERMKKLKKKKISDMTDQELQDRINRLQLEQRYSELVKSSAPKKGKSWVTSQLEEAAKGSLKNLAEQTFDTLGGESINRIGQAFAGWDPSDPQQRVVNPRKRQSAKK